MFRISEGGRIRAFESIQRTSFSTQLHQCKSEITQWKSMNFKWCKTCLLCSKCVVFLDPSEPCSPHLTMKLHALIPCLHLCRPLQSGVTVISGKMRIFQELIEQEKEGEILFKILSRLAEAWYNTPFTISREHWDFSLYCSWYQIHVVYTLEHCSVLISWVLPPCN